MHNQTLYLEHFQLQQNPFRQEPNPELFFPEAGRGDILNRLLSDIVGGEPLVNLTGSEGVGKTLLYLRLAQKLPADTFDLVCLDHPVGSFEDLLRIICHALRSESNRQAVPRQSHLPEFREYIQERAATKRKILLIIDEAEKLFLATLERLVRLICDTGEGNVLQILLIGRPELEKNIEQLVIYCSGVDVNAGYVLEPLTLPETEKYLRYRLKRAGTQGDKHREIFSADAVSTIYQVAGGNISLTNMLAEKGLKLACDAGMFMVDGVLLDPQQKDGSVLAGILAGWKRLQEYKRWLLSLASLLLVISLISFWPHKKQESPAEKPRNQVEHQIEQQNRVANTDSAPEKAAGKTTEKNPSPAATAAPDSQPSAAAGEGKIPATALDIPAPGEEQAIVIQPAARKKKGEEPPPVLQEAAAEAARDGDLIFDERLRDTSSWLAWSYRGGFTIQLMVLASDTAEENLKNLLVQDDYYGVRDNLYIMRKASSPALLVFYGLYDTMEEARRVRDELPQFLRSHQPYALSIDEALKKTEQ